MPPPDLLPAPTELPARRVVVVLGMHRGGTSLVAGCLQRLGVDFGPRLMPANADNPHGYFEHNDVVNLHDRLLLALGRSWDETAPFPDEWWRDEALLAPYRERLLGILRRDFSATPLWGLKDPRLCLLLPWWESVWPEIGFRPLFLLVRRHPGEVAASLARREEVSLPKAHLLWLRHLLAAERESRSHERVLLDFDEVRRDEHAALAPVREALGLPPADGRLADPTLGQPLQAAVDRAMPPWVQATDEALRLGRSGNEARMRAVFDEVSTQLRAADALLCPTLAEQSSDLRQELTALRRQARWYEEEWTKAQGRVDTLKQRLEKSKSRAGK